MLGTIRVPKNLRLLSERLPKSNYGGNSKKTAILSSKAEISNKEATKQDVLSTSELLAMAIPPRAQTKNVSDDLHAIIEEDLHTPSLQMLDPPTPESIGATPKQIMISKSERRPNRPPVSNGAVIN